MQKQYMTPDKKTSLSRTGRGYEQPTIASKSRSPSPYTKRRMCELSEDYRQRLAHLNLGPYEFKKETDYKPPFVVKHVESLIPSPEATLTLCSSKVITRQEVCDRLLTDASLLGSYRPVDPKMPARKQFDDLGAVTDSTSKDSLPAPVFRKLRSASFSFSSSTHKHPDSPVLHRSSLRERFQSHHRATVNWEEIHTRVKNMLRTHSARQQLHFSTSSNEDIRSMNPSHNDSLHIHELQDSTIYAPEKPVHLDNGEFWSSRAAEYKGKSHRAVFEESMEKIYKNMYRNSSDPNMYRKSYNS